MHRRRITREQLAAMPLSERHEVVRAQLTRRALLNAAPAALLAPGPLLLVPPADRSSSGQQNIKHQWIAFGPDPSRQITVRWQTSGPVVRPRVRVGTDLGYGREVTGEQTPLSTARPDGFRIVQYYAVAHIEGLRPDTRYHYQIVHDGAGGGTVTTGDATFRTAPAPGAAGPFSFTAFGDQGLEQASRRMTRLVARLQPSFHLLAGDISYADSTGEGLATDHFVPQRWGDYFEQIDPVARTVPWMVTPGNHDMEALYGPDGYGGFRARFAMPENGPRACPGTYWFRYGPVAVVSLDANDVTSQYKANFGYSEGTQREWARERLASLRSDPDVDFIVAVFHQCAYASGLHGSDAGVRAAFSSLLDEYAVDLVINGHNHSYERTDPIRAGRATRTAPSGSTVDAARDGTTYVICGGGGGALTGFGTTPDRNDLVPYHGPDAIDIHVQGGPNERVAWSRARYNRHTVVAVNVTPGSAGTASTMVVRALNEDGVAVDTVTLSRAPSARSFVNEHEGLLSVAGGVATASAAAGGLFAIHRSRRRKGDGTGDAQAHTS